MDRHRKLLLAGWGLFFANSVLAVAFLVYGYWVSGLVSGLAAGYLAVRLRNQIRFMRCAAYCNRLNARLAEITAGNAIYEHINEVEMLVDQYEAAVEELKRLRHL